MLSRKAVVLSAPLSLQTLLDAGLLFYCWGFPNTYSEDVFLLFGQFPKFLIGVQKEKYMLAWEGRHKLPPLQIFI